ncbi:MAG TPA: flavodoxin family protein [Caulobacteraceae bacterium]|nr:flavodoxin family protein [Caulobacteraceae bacterium]
MSRISVLYFSGYGHAAKVAEAVERGAGSVPGADVRVHRISEAGELPDEAWAALGEADAIVYGSPTYMGGPAWQFKKVAEASSRLWLSQSWKDKVAAGFTVSAATNGDKFSTIQYFWTFSQQHGQIWVGAGLLPSNAKAHGPADINWSGGSSGVFAIAPADASPEEAPGAGDIAAAEALGERVARLAARLRG